MTEHVVPAPLIIDSVDDFATGYHFFGSEPVGQPTGQPPVRFPQEAMPPPAEEPPATGPQVIHLDVVDKISVSDQMHLMNEMEADPDFAPYLASLVTEPDAYAAINREAMKATINELDPSQYQETKGKWKVLRREAQQISSVLPTVVDEHIKGMDHMQKMAVLQRMRQAKEASMSGMGGLGILDAIVGGIFDLGGDYLQTQLQGDIAEDLAKAQGKIDLQLGREKIAAEKEIAEKKLEMEAALAAKEIGIAEQVATGGLPAWAIPAGIGAIALAVLAYMWFGRKR